MRDLVILPKKTQFSEYSPISILPFLSKCFSIPSSIIIKSSLHIARVSVRQQLCCSWQTIFAKPWRIKNWLFWSCLILVMHLVPWILTFWSLSGSTMDCQVLFRCYLSGRCHCLLAMALVPNGRSCVSEAPWALFWDCFLFQCIFLPYLTVSQHPAYNLLMTYKTFCLRDLNRTIAKLNEDLMSESRKAGNVVFGLSSLRLRQSLLVRLIILYFDKKGIFLINP